VSFDGGLRMRPMWRSQTVTMPIGTALRHLLRLTRGSSQYDAARLRIGQRQPRQWNWPI
jgi:hypothetical protein